jgi:hypothetical protein
MTQPISHDYLIIGAGPAGIQLGYFFKKSGKDYLILEAGDSAGTFFEKYPRHRKLLSINKVYTGTLSCATTGIRSCATTSGCNSRTIVRATFLTPTISSAILSISRTFTILTSNTIRKYLKSPRKIRLSSWTIKGVPTPASG